MPISSRTFADSASFDCHWQCTECGFQVATWVTDTGRDSYRTQPDDRPLDRRPAPACEGCGATGTWANLREGGVVEALIVQDESRQSTRGARRSGLVKLVSLAVWVGVGALTFDNVAAWMMMPLMGGTAAVMLHSAYAEYVSGRRARCANSWSHEPVPRGRVKTRLEGRVGADERLRAPLSGRVCVGYELGVRHDIDTNADPWSWTLLEQRSAAGLSIDGVAVSGRPYLRLERKIYAEELSAAAHMELRKRGLDPSRPGYSLFETIVEAGELVTVERRRTGIVLGGGS